MRVRYRPNEPRDATQGAVMRLHVVCPSVTFRYQYHDHTGRNSSNIISPPNSDKIVMWRSCVIVGCLIALAYNFHETYTLGASRGRLCDSTAFLLYMYIYMPFHLLSAITSIAYTWRNSNGIALVCRVEFDPFEPVIHRGFSGRWCCYHSCRDTGDNVDQTTSRH